MSLSLEPFMRLLLITLFYTPPGRKNPHELDVKLCFVCTFIFLGLKLSLLDMCRQEGVWEYAAMTEEHFLLGV